MNRKTPDEIATDVILSQGYDTRAYGDLTESDIETAIKLGIEADRANREEALKAQVEEVLRKIGLRETSPSVKAPLVMTLCEECNEDAEPKIGTTTHCECCGVRVWS
jgi:hypothetical protein